MPHGPPPANVDRHRRARGNYSRGRQNRGSLLSNRFHDNLQNPSGYGTRVQSRAGIPVDAETHQRVHPLTPRSLDGLALVTKRLTEALDSLGSNAGLGGVPGTQVATACNFVHWNRRAYLDFMDKATPGRPSKVEMPIASEGRRLRFRGA